MRSLPLLAPAHAIACCPEAAVSLQLLRQLVPWSQHTTLSTAAQPATVAAVDTTNASQQQRHCCIWHNQQQSTPQGQQQQQQQRNIWQYQRRHSVLYSKQIHQHQQFQLQHGFASLPCRLTEDNDSSKEPTLSPSAAAPAAASTGFYRGLTSAGSRGSSSGSGGGGGGSSGGGEDVDEDTLQRRRRSTTESRAALRRTTESRAAVEDVAVMSKSQLLRRKKAWLAEQCWERKLPHDGLKDDLVQRLLGWQVTEHGQAAAAEAVASAQAAMAALASAKTVDTAAGQQVNTVPGVQAQGSQKSSSDAQHEAGIASDAAADAAAAAAASYGPPGAQSSSSISGRSVQGRRHRKSEVAVGADEDSSASGHDSNTGSNSSFLQGMHKGPSHITPAGQPLQQPPRSAAAAATGSIIALLQQLKEQPDNAALVAVARNALEVHARTLEANLCSSSGSSQVGWHGQDSAQQAAARAADIVQELAETLTGSSSPQSLAALAKSCYSREVQSALLAAAVAEAVAAVASQLGPQEVYGVLRLLVEHFGIEGQGFGGDQGVQGCKAMMKGFRALAEGMIRYSNALHSRQLTEAVQLLAVHRYDDPYGLWMIAREATERLREFEPADVVILTDAIAGMCVADDALCDNVAAVVGSRKASYSQQQLKAVEAALHKMGWSNVL